MAFSTPVGLAWDSPPPSHRVYADGQTDGCTDVRTYGLIGYQISLAMELRWRALPTAPLLINCYNSLHINLMLLVPTYSQPPGLQSQFSFGDFSALSPLPDSKVKINVQVDEEFSVKVDLGHDGDSLFSCPNDGCTQTYMRYYGKCELRPVKETLMDQAKALF